MGVFVLKIADAFWKTPAQHRSTRACAQFFVEDPAVAFRGSPACRDDVMATAVVIWRLLGFKLAFDKAQKYSSVVWVGGLKEIFDDCVIVSIPHE